MCRFLHTVEVRGSKITPKPLNARRVEVIGVGPGSVLHLPEGRVDAPVFQRAYRVVDGVLAPSNY
jgi:hypothetical protein